MHEPHFWVLKEPVDTCFFDCDGTLSLIEGIDVLATMNGVEEQVHQITHRCMSQTGLSINDYRDRLNYVQPTANQLFELAELYIRHCSSGARELIQLLHYLNKKTYIISAGIKTAVSQFALNLGIAPQDVLAVDLYFDEQNEYKGFNEHSNLIKAHGKPIEIASILKPHERSILIGDGISDWEASKTVTRFIGYAGLKAKEWIKNHSDFYITEPSLFAAIPLCLTQKEVQQLPPEYLAYYEQGLAEINHSHVLMKENNHVHYSST